MLKNNKKKEALESVPTGFRVLQKNEVVQKTDWLWTGESNRWMKANYLIGECKAAEFVCAIRGQMNISPNKKLPPHTHYCWHHYSEWSCNCEEPYFTNALCNNCHSKILGKGKKNGLWS